MVKLRPLDVPLEHHELISKGEVFMGDSERVRKRTRRRVTTVRSSMEAFPMKRWSEAQPKIGKYPFPL